MSDTPETDKVKSEWQDSWSRATGREEFEELSRRLERERNESRKEAELFRDNALAVLRGGGRAFPVGNQFSWENDQEHGPAKN